MSRPLARIFTNERRDQNESTRHRKRNHRIRRKESIAGEGTRGRLCRPQVRRLPADISHPESLKALFSRIGSFDAVANAAGDVSFGALEEAALPFIADRASFTLVSGVLTDEYLHGGTIGTTINHLVEGFVKGSAVELPRGLRINCISPTVLAESVAYHAYFAGFIPVPAWEVGQAYLRAMSTPITGRILKLHKTSC